MARLLRAWVRPLVAVAVLAGGAAGLCGCSDESEPSVSVTPTVTGGGVLSPSPSPSPTVLPELTEQELLELLPESATNESFPGAVDFAQWFIAESRQMFDDGDTRLFEASSGEGCGYCDNALGEFADLAATGERMDGGQISYPSDAADGGLQPDGSWVIGLDVRQAELSYVDANGEPVDSVAALEARVNIKLVFESGRWRVLGVGAGS